MPASKKQLPQAKPRRQAHRPKGARPVTQEVHSWLAVEIIYDAPRTAAYDAMWREIIEQALDWLDAQPGRAA